MAAALPCGAVERMLKTKLGMQERKGDHRRFELVVDERVVATTFVSRGSEKYRILGDDLVTKMARQMHVTSGFFGGLVHCHNSKDDYIQALRDQGRL